MLITYIFRVSVKLQYHYSYFIKSCLLDKLDIFCRKNFGKSSEDSIECEISEEDGTCIGFG